MTPEQRAAEMIQKFGKALKNPQFGANNPFRVLEADIAAALKPSEAVRELLRAADELRTIMHLDGATKTPRYDKAAAAVRKELGL